ncbi:MAG: hypothetical protein IJV40_12655 [Oscillospiraceae bacterium]|nr:hypothetical protein [Oscillospiraceae bacterium]
MEQKKQKTAIFDSKIFWIVISLLSSLAIWIYVVSTENSVVTQIFRGVQVEIVGEEALRNSRNLIVTDVDTNNVRVEIRGPRRIVDALDSEDLTAQIDVSKLSRSAYASMKYKLVYPDGVDTRNLAEVSYSPETVNFMVSNLNSVSVPVRGGFEGKLADGYTAESPMFEPSTITVTGPDAYLKDVSYAWVSFGVGQTVSSSHTEDAPFVLMNSSGDAVSTEYLTASEETVTATLPILQIKDIPLSVELIEGSGATTANTVVTITPDRITLAGDSAILDGMNRIILSTVDLSEFRSSFSETYTIPFDNSLRNISGVTEAKVDIEVIGLSTETFTVKNISVINLPEGVNAEIISESIDVVIRGTEEELAQLTPESIRAVADLTDYKDSTGPFMVTAKIYVDGFVDVGAVGSNQISVDLSRS